MAGGSVSEIDDKSGTRPVKTLSRSSWYARMTQYERLVLNAAVLRELTEDEKTAVYRVHTMLRERASGEMGSE
ncbi:MAG: hypothetical protein E6Q97_19390 [Desulfurellales bacterium]|nr:MAG: hypothetical protein E6Q97_19390 [Desulfurellales bacterium]